MIVLSIILVLLCHGRSLEVPKQRQGLHELSEVAFSKVQSWSQDELDRFAILALALNPKVKCGADAKECVNSRHAKPCARDLSRQSRVIEYFGRPRSRSTSQVTMQADEAANVLFDFAGNRSEAAIDAWERIDDVIMGGISSSRLVLSSDGSGAIFEGRIRSDGGGFCGQRMRLLSEPLDLSKSSGMFIDCVVLPDVGADPNKRVWKIAIRTKQDRGEVVYQAQFKPPRKRSTVRVPFEKFRLVRGPRLVPGAPPLTSSQMNETYQMSIIVTKFMVSENLSALPDFEEGPFALKLFRVGTYGYFRTPKIPRPLTAEEQAAASPILVRLLRPLLSSLFSEKARRRRAATKLLQARGTARMQRIRLGWAWRKAELGVIGATQRTIALTLRDGMGLLLSIPLRLLFRLVLLLSRLSKKLISLVKRNT